MQREREERKKKTGNEKGRIQHRENQTGRQE